MKQTQNERERNERCTGDADDHHGVSRRRFLQITGGAAALATGGGILYFLSRDTAIEKTALPAGNTLATNETTRHSLTQRPTLAPGEAMRLRHLRHRRQYRDGVYDITFDSYEDCERNCIGALNAHELRWE